MPELYIIAGSNGAGKSTVGPDYLPNEIRKSNTVFDGDKLFMQKRAELWQQGIKANKESKKLAMEHVEATFDQLVETALEQHIDFVYEGHFTNEATWDIPRRFKAAGYTIHILFLGLKDVATSEMRVIDRTKVGGHYVDPLTVQDNFYGNLEKLNEHYGMFDTVQVIDSTEPEHISLATFSNGILQTSAPRELIPAWFSSNLPAMVNKLP